MDQQLFRKRLEHLFTTAIRDAKIGDLVNGVHFAGRQMREGILNNAPELVGTFDEVLALANAHRREEVERELPKLREAARHFVQGGELLYEPHANDGGRITLLVSGKPLSETSIAWFSVDDVAMSIARAANNETEARVRGFLELPAERDPGPF